MPVVEKWETPLRRHPQAAQLCAVLFWAYTPDNLERCSNALWDPNFNYAGIGTGNAVGDTPPPGFTIEFLRAWAQVLNLRTTGVEYKTCAETLRGCEWVEIFERTQAIISTPDEYWFKARGSATEPWRFTIAVTISRWDLGKTPYKTAYDVADYITHKTRIAEEKFPRPRPPTDQEIIGAWTWWQELPERDKKNRRRIAARRRAGEEKYPKSISLAGAKN